VGIKLPETDFKTLTNLRVSRLLFEGINNLVLDTSAVSQNTIDRISVIISERKRLKAKEKEWSFSTSAM